MSVDWNPVFGLPNGVLCSELDLPATLYCRRTQVVKSRIGIGVDAFNKAVDAEIITKVFLAGEINARYYTAQVIDVFVKGAQGRSLKE